jgi:hypothetical protein
VVKTFSCCTVRLYVQRSLPIPMYPRQLLRRRVVYRWAARCFCFGRSSGLLLRHRSTHYTPLPNRLHEPHQHIPDPACYLGSSIPAPPRAPPPLGQHTVDVTCMCVCAGERRGGWEGVLLSHHVQVCQRVSFCRRVRPLRLDRVPPRNRGEGSTCHHRRSLPRGRPATR